MLIAREKEKDNIAEYILYMWQMEDLIRGSEMNLEKILQKVFQKENDDDKREEYSRWFIELIEEMKRDNLTKTGHIKGVKTYMKSLENLHHSLLTVYQDQKYVALYKKAGPFVNDLRTKSASNVITETEICLVGLYGFLLLKMSGKEISEETKNAMKEISQLIAYLAEAFNKLKSGELQLPSRLNN